MWPSNYHNHTKNVEIFWNIVENIEATNTKILADN